eukprot:SAG31_NODE_462_length_15340_cov_2.972968_8_plen_60_part_00
MGDGHTRTNHKASSQCTTLEAAPAIALHLILISLIAQHHARFEDMGACEARMAEEGVEI